MILFNSFITSNNVQHKIKHTYYGKIEERMPFAAVHLPIKFRQSQPKLYEQFVQNTNRFTSTFDLHETLKDLIQMRVGSEQILETTKRIGRSLFEKIPINRNCTDAKVPKNFCVCMEKQDEQLNIKALKVRINFQSSFVCEKIIPMTS